MIKRARIRRAWVTGLTMLALVLSPLLLVTDSRASTTNQQFFDEAAKEYNVPVEVLISVSFHTSRWEDHEGKPSADGGYGPMHLRDIKDALKTNGRGDDKERKTAVPDNEVTKTLEKAADLTGQSTDNLKKDYKQNLRGGAALLASYAKEVNDGKLPTALEGWYGAVTKYSSSTDLGMAESFADDVYETIKSGASATLPDGQQMKLEAKAEVKSDKNQLNKLERMNKRFTSRKHRTNNNGAECPRDLTCQFVPARFAQNDPNNVYDYGNYDQAKRPEDQKIKYIVVHDMEGSYDSSIAWFQNPASYVSAHYLIRSSDGEVTQMVKNKDVAWHAGNWYMNMHSIGIEHEGFAAEGATWYTEEMYRSSAKLVRYLAKKYDIPMDRQHILGHDEYTGVSPAANANMHHDPGPFWNWDHYMDLVTDHGWKHGDKHMRHSNAVTISPKFETNKPEVISCNFDDCNPLPEQSANFVYLYREPSESAARITDAAIHPGGANGTSYIQDTAAKAVDGRKYVVAGKQGDWMAIWFNGQKAWFNNKDGMNARKTQTKVVTPKNGMDKIAVYGRPVPEESAFPASLTPPPLQPTPLQYEIPAGQEYALVGKPKNDYYHMWTFDASGPGDGTVVVGKEKYYAIAYGHRTAFVKASDVDIKW